MTNLIPTPSVSLINGRPATTSLKIAEHFGKRHDNVVRDIRKIMAETPEDFRALNFEETIQTVPGPNNSQRQEVYFTVYFDGFMLLVMGYTGKQALQIKLVYIAAFNAMREQLAGHPHQPTPALDTDTRLSKRADPERKELRAMVNAWVGCAPLHYAAASSIINAHFGVKGVDEMTVAQVKQAIEFVRGKVEEAAAAPKALPPAPEPSLRDEWLKAFVDYERDQRAGSVTHDVFTEATRRMILDSVNHGHTEKQYGILKVLDSVLLMQTNLRFAARYTFEMGKMLTEQEA